MTDFNPDVHDEEYFARRMLPAIMTYLSPFRVVNGSEYSPWEASLEQVNRGGWDYSALHEIVGSVDVGLPPPCYMFFCRDGGVGLPPLPQFRNDQESVEFFNRCFAALLIGGVYCEAVRLDGLEFGTVLNGKYLRSNTFGSAAPNRIHKQFRMGCGSPLDTILLLEPRTVELTELNRAMNTGRKILSLIPELSPEFLLKGTTGYARRAWGDALANLWIVVEQVSSHLWASAVQQPAKRDVNIPGRAKQLADFRSYSTGVRLEVLYQLGKISNATLKDLSIARKARNNLSHDGKHPTSTAAKAAWEGVKGLVQSAVPDAKIPLFDIDLENYTLSDPFSRSDPMTLEPTHWMEIPKLPGEKELESLRTAFRRHRRDEKTPDT